MIRYLEYIYLLGAVAIGVFMALNFEHLELSHKILLGIGAIVCGFMFSFRRKQREMMAEFDRKQAQDEQEDETQSTEEDGH